MHLQPKQVASSASYVATCTTHQETLNSKHTRALPLYALEYCCSVWDPFTQRNTNKIQAVQNRAARFISNDYKWQSSVSGMIKDLKLHPLPARRKLIRLSTFHKIKHGIIDLELEDHINPAQAPRGMATRSYHPDNYSNFYTARHFNCTRQFLLP